MIVKSLLDGINMVKDTTADDILCSLDARYKKCQQCGNYYLYYSDHNQTVVMNIQFTPGMKPDSSCCVICSYPFTLYRNFTYGLFSLSDLQSLYSPKANITHTDIAFNIEPKQ